MSVSRKKKPADLRGARWFAPDDLRARKAAWKQPESRYERGYGWMFTRHIKQANEGCDFDFLETRFGKSVAEPSIY